MLNICPGCQRSVEPLEELVKDPKTKKAWLIQRCPFERCKFNIDISETNVRLWNDRLKYFEDLTDS